MEIKRIDNESKGLFKALENNEEAGIITYSMAGHDKIIINHTEVHPIYKGKGVGKLLVLETRAFARSNQLKIIALCPFAKYILHATSDHIDLF